MERLETATTMFVVLWEFDVKDGSELEFEEEYGSGGAWAEFFRQDPAFRETRLLRDAAQKRRYYTLDFWASRAAYEAFRERRRQEYARIDAKCEALTTKETPMGTFES